MNRLRGAAAHAPGSPWVASRPKPVKRSCHSPQTPFSAASLRGEPRLGAGGTGIAAFPSLDSIDASAITKERFGLSHSYFGDNETVMCDLFLVIHQGLEPNKRPRLVKAKGSRGEYWELREAASLYPVNT